MGERVSISLVLADLILEDYYETFQIKKIARRWGVGADQVQQIVSEDKARGTSRRGGVSLSDADSNGDNNPLRRAAKVLEGRLDRDRKGLPLLDGRPVSLRDMVRCANDALGGIGAPKIVYPGAD